MLHLEIFWISKSFSQPLASSILHGLSPANRRIISFLVFNLQSFFVIIKNIFVMTNLTSLNFIRLLQELFSPLSN